MIINIPNTWIGFYFIGAETVYLVVNSILVGIYVLSRIPLIRGLLAEKVACWYIIPPIIFLFSGIMIVSIPLIVFAVIFAVLQVIRVIKTLNNLSTSRPMKKGLISMAAIVVAFAITFGSTFGGIVASRNSLSNRLSSMTASEMIDYDCQDSNVKISVAVIDNGNVTTHVYGNKGEESTVYSYEIGSVSKTFVGLLCAKAVSEGKLNLSDSISKYLDLNANTYYPTIERLLTHTAGYESYYFESSMISNKFAQIDNDYYGISKDQILSTVKSVKLQDKSYDFVYSNFGISVVGLVLEKVYGTSFANLMNSFIANTLKLENTGVAMQSGNLSGYWKWKTSDGYMPAGAIISNINDMAKYLTIFMSGSLSYASETYKKLSDVNVDGISGQYNININSVGMTWMLDDVNNVVWHNGATTNFNSYVGFTKDGGKGVIVLGNLGSDDRIPMSVIGAKLLIG
jgi:CubicO group peptidase (beta-lactamase class C family)